MHEENNRENRPSPVETDDQIEIEEAKKTCLEYNKTAAKGSAEDPVKQQTKDCLAGQEEQRPQHLQDINEGFEMAKKLYEEQLRQEEENMKLPHYREALRLSKEAEDLAMSKKRHDPEKALRLAHEAAALHPEFRDCVQSVENWNSYRARKGKVNIKKAVREVLRPHMLELGFTEMVPRAEDVVPQWLREYACALSRLDPRQKYPLENKSTYFFRGNAFLTVGAARGGNALSLYAGKKIGDRIEEFTKNHRPNPDFLIYLNQEELCEALRRLNDYIDEYFIPWITV